ncbi:MAG: branched-chain amino acid ABC transporter permease [Deltaproteobacteria bacterium]|nr:branched-chain amino acid ABC transporter permease [Deltaproteobacteria bacterium]
MTLQMFVQSLINSILSGGVLILIAMGLTIILGIMKVVNFAHGEFYMLGGFGIWWFFAEHGLNFVLALILSVTLVGILGVAIERGLFKPFRENAFPSLIISCGILLVFRAATQLSFGLVDHAVPTPEAFKGMIQVSGAFLSKERLIVICITLALIIGLYVFIKFTKAGLAMRAVSDNPAAASLQGMSVDRISSLAFFIGSVLAATAGCLTGPIFYVSPTMGAEPGLMAFVVIVLGGIGSITGTVIAGLIIGFIEGFGAIPFGTNYATVMVYVVLLITLIFKPMGLLGHAEK